MSAKEYWTSMKHHIYIMSKCSISVCYKVSKDFWFYINIYFLPKELLLENGRLYLPKGKNLIFMRNSYVSTSRLRKAFGIRIFNSKKLSFRSTVTSIPRSFQLQFYSRTLKNVHIPFCKPYMNSFARRLPEPDNFWITTSERFQFHM